MSNDTKAVVARLREAAKERAAREWSSVAAELTPEWEAADLIETLTAPVDGLKALTSAVGDRTACQRIWALLTDPPPPAGDGLAARIKEQDRQSKFRRDADPKNDPPELERERVGQEIKSLRKRAEKAEASLAELQHRATPLANLALTWDSPGYGDNSVIAMTVRIGDLRALRRALLTDPSPPAGDEPDTNLKGGGSDSESARRQTQGHPRTHIATPARNPRGVFMMSDPVMPSFEEMVEAGFAASTYGPVSNVRAILAAVLPRVLGPAKEALEPFGAALTDSDRDRISKWDNIDGARFSTHPLVSDLIRARTVRDQTAKLMEAGDG